MNSFEALRLIRPSFVRIVSEDCVIRRVFGRLWAPELSSEIQMLRRCPHHEELAVLETINRRGIRERNIKLDSMTSSSIGIWFDCDQTTSTL